MKIKVVHAKKLTELATIELPETATVEDLNNEIRKSSRIGLTSQNCSDQAKIDLLRVGNN